MSAIARGATLARCITRVSLVKEIYPTRRIWIAEARVSLCISQRHLARHEKHHGNQHPDEFGGWLDMEGNTCADRDSEDHADQPTTP